MSCNSEITLVFYHVVLTKTLGIHRARDIRTRVSRRVDLWERGLHTVLVGDMEEEGDATEGRSFRGGDEEEKALNLNFHSTVLSGNIWQAIRRATNREGVGYLLPDNICT